MSGTQYVRKLATAAAVSLALASGGAFGLGLGDIEMRSALNQPMEAEIRLTAVKPGELEGMIVQLASADAFARAGIDRSQALIDLTFSVDQSGPAPIIRISSNRPVVEPFLNFLLEVDWPQGRMIREYTVLLDPPVFMTPSASDRNTAADQPTVVQRGDEALVVPTPIQRDGVEVELFDSADAEFEGDLVELDVLEGGQEFDGGFQVDSGSSPFQGEVVPLSDLSAPNTSAIQERTGVENFDGFEVEVLGNTDEVSNSNPGIEGNGRASTANGDGSTIVSLDSLSGGSSGSSNGSVTVQQGDTLYEIAQSNAVGGASIQQMMLALLKTNESSFINGNINLVKAGATLRLPSASEATALSQNQALAAIGEQNQLWRDYRDSLRGSSGTRLAGTSSLPGSDSPLPSVELFDNDDDGALSPAAQQILDNARSDLQNREELTLLAENSSIDDTSLATTDETFDSDADRQGAINQRLQLAREELSSSRLQSDDLEDQLVELQSTSDNQDALVNLRENNLANLEAQLEEARNNNDDSVNAIQDVIAEGGGDSTVDLLADSSTATQELTDSGSNALTEAGQDLGQVELYSENNNTATNLDSGATAFIPPPEPKAWYENLLAEPMKLLIAGIGLLGLLGLGALMFLGLRRRRKEPEEEMGFGEGVDFIDEAEAAELQAEMGEQGFDDFDDFGEVATASGATAASSDFDDFDAMSALDEGDSYDESQAFDSVDDTQVQEHAFDTEVDAEAIAAVDAAMDKDDTISEVDVYLAYGLHGQAEELLNKAIEDKPNQPEYAHKLLQTYHAQGNGDGFVDAAKNFHARFGGEANPDWAGIAAMGAELRPDEPLFELPEGAVPTLGADFSNDSVAFTEDDFLPASDNDLGSVNRSMDAADSIADSSDLDFPEEGFSLSGKAAAATAAVTAGAASVAAAASSKLGFGGDKDETDLMDQSIDPAFAFDEADLEATGDFSQIADELAAEAGGSVDSIDFPGLDDTLSVDNSASMLDDTIVDEDGLAGGLTMDELDGVIGTADDLTLDLDQLSGDLELDTAELMNSDLSDIELPELSVSDELAADDVVARAANNDEDAMDTMLDLAKAYIDMGDKDSASSALDEIVKSGNPAQVSEAESLLRNIS